MTTQPKPMPINNREVINLLVIFKRIAERVARTQPRKRKSMKA